MVICTLRKSGKSLIITIPKTLCDMYKLRPGDRVSINDWAIEPLGPAHVRMIKENRWLEEKRPR